MTMLADAVADIMDAIVDAIRDEVDDSSSDLNAVATVVRGDHARPMPDLPAIWVVPAQQALFTQAEFGDSEDCTLDVSIAALVKSSDPEAGGRLAQRLAPLASRAALRARTAATIDVRSRAIDVAARSSERNPLLVWSEVTVRVWFTVDE